MKILLSLEIIPIQIIRWIKVVPIFRKFLNYSSNLRYTNTTFEFGDRGCIDEEMNIYLIPLCNKNKHKS